MTQEELEKLEAQREQVLAENDAKNYNYYLNNGYLDKLKDRTGWGIKNADDFNSVVTKKDLRIVNRQIKKDKRSAENANMLDDINRQRAAEGKDLIEEGSLKAKFTVGKQRTGNFFQNNAGQIGSLVKGFTKMFNSKYEDSNSGEYIKELQAAQEAQAKAQQEEEEKKEKELEKAAEKERYDNQMAMQLQFLQYFTGQKPPIASPDQLTDLQSTNVKPEDINQSGSGSQVTIASEIDQRGNLPLQAAGEGTDAMLNKKLKTTKTAKKGSKINFSRIKAYKQKFAPGGRIKYMDEGGPAPDGSTASASIGSNGLGATGNKIMGSMGSMGFDAGTFGQGFSNSIESPQEQGKYGNITKGMDSAYDQIQGMVSQMGPWGKVAGMAMGANKALGKVVSKVGGGTDGMTKKDAIMGSAFLQMTPIGLINGFGGAKSHTLDKTLDETSSLYGEETISGFGGTSASVEDASQYSNKKYGLFSTKERKKANRAIDTLNTQLSQIKDIAAASKDAFDIRSSMSSVNEQSTAFDLQGGYDQGAVHVGKHGMKIESNYNNVFLSKNKINYNNVFSFKNYYDSDDEVDDLKLFKNGGSTKLEVPEIFELDEELGLYKTGLYADDNEAFKSIKKLKKDPKYKAFFKNYEVLNMGPKYDDLLYFVPSNKKKEIYKKIREEARELEAKESGGFGGANDYANDFEKLFNQGKLQQTGEFASDGQPIWENVDTGDTYTERPISSFKTGGQMNVIPEGHLHARLHHMDDADGITKKGIPVVDYDGELQAEIELNEIIFNKEVTILLEKYYKENTDKSAIAAGKLLAEEIIEHTDDRTGLIDTIKSEKNGGTL